MGRSFLLQVGRLLAAGFSEKTLADVADRLKRKFRGLPQKAHERPKGRPAIIPYLHAVSHNLKKVAGRFNVPVVFTAPSKLSSLCKRINYPHRDREECTKKHRNKFLDCSTCVVYDIPLSCGRSYVGQTGRCVNERAREHASAVKQTPSGHLAVHCARCPCTPMFTNTAILGRHSEKTTREVHEAFIIKTRGVDKCVSEPSVALLDKEILFLEREWGGRT
uniref:Putative tick transposon n=1 Tax=Ixodes ricinus TaxID=34613 RepID=A0A147BL58_IXORI